MITGEAEEATLIQAAQVGDREAFNQVMLKYQQPVYRRAYWITMDPDRAEDLTQEAFLRAYRSLASFRRGSFGAWMWRIVTNASLDEMRREQRRPAQTKSWENEKEEFSEWEQTSAPLLTIEDMIEQAEVRAELRGHLQHLPASYRAALILVDLHQHDYAEAAQMLGIPIGTLKSRVMRARLKLKKHLANRGGQHPLQMR